MSTQTMYLASTDANHVAETNVDDAYQKRVGDWLIECFGPETASSVEERLHRFIEEALELAQAVGCTRGEVDQLVEYVYSRPVGDPQGEVGGVMVTLAGLCTAAGIGMQHAAETELAKNRRRTAQIRAKREAKRPGSPLPQ